MMKVTRALNVKSTRICGWRDIMMVTLAARGFCQSNYTAEIKYGKKDGCDTEPGPCPYTSYKVCISTAFRTFTGILLTYRLRGTRN